MGSLACLGAARSPARWAREGLGAPQATFAWGASCSLVLPPPRLHLSLEKAETDF